MSKCVLHTTMISFIRLAEGGDNRSGELVAFCPKTIAGTAPSNRNAVRRVSIMFCSLEEGMPRVGKRVFFQDRIFTLLRSALIPGLLDRCAPRSACRTALWLVVSRYIWASVASRRD